MGEINEPITISLIFDHTKRKSLIAKILWKDKVYKITKHGLHHTYRKGDTLFHVFSVSSDTISFRLLFNTNSLNWVLESVYDETFR